MLARPMPFDPVMVSPRSGLPEVNPEAGQLQYWAQGTEKLSRVPINAGGTAEDVIYVTADKNGAGDFNPILLSYRALGAFRLLLEANGGINKRLTNGYVNADFIASPAGAFPCYFSTPLWLESKTGLRVRYQNVSATVANEVELVAHGRRLVDVTPEQRKKVLEKYYMRSEWPMWLGLDDVVVTLAANQAGFQTKITVPADGDVQAEYLLAKSTGPFRVQAQDQNGTPLLYGGGPSAVGGSKPTGVASIHVTGSTLFPYRMPMSGFLNRQEILNVTLEDLSGGENTIELCIVGRCLGYPEGDGRAGSAGYVEPMDESLRAIAYAQANPMPQNAWSPARQAAPVTPALTVPVPGTGWVPKWLPK